jgi:6-methylsalicylate decarboxylase
MRYIDVHHHILPDFYIEAVGVGPITDQAPRFARAALDWTPGKSLQAMDECGVDTAYLSISAPGLGAEAARPTLARRCNDYMADMGRRHRGRFGMFAALPLPDVAASLAEIRHCREQLNAAGYGLLSSYGNRHLGDPAFRPVFEELNRARAIVFVHPTITDACRALLPGIPASILEFPLDTTRCAMSLLYSGVLRDCPDIRFIFSHAGGAVPFLCNRMARLDAVDEFAEKTGGQAMALLQRQYYDTALSATPQALAALEAFVPSSQILYGSDFPFAVGMMGKSIAALEARYGATERLEAVARGSALALMGEG